MNRDWKTLIEKNKDYTGAQLARKFNVSREYIRQLCNKHDIKLDISYSQFPPEERKKILSLGKKKMSVMKISKIVGRSDSSIRKFLIKNSIEPIRERKYGFNEDYFLNIDSKEKAYFLGFFLRRGSIQNDCSFRLASGSNKILERLKRAIGSNSPIKVIRQEISDKVFSRYLLTICSKRFVSNLKDKGIVHNISERLKYFIIEVDNQISFPYPNYVNEFLVGVGDGSNEKTMKKVKDLIFLKKYDII